MSKKSTKPIKDSVDDVKRKQEEEKAKKVLWEAGFLKWKLKGKQTLIYDHFKNSEDDMATVLVSRQFGKSFVLCILSIEQCLSVPGSIIKYVCPKQKMVERIIKPRIKEIIRDCPEHLKPEWKSQDKVWLFPNGSEIQVAGCDNGNYDNIRGGSAHLCIADECGFIDELDTVIFSVLSPTTDTTGGKIYLASTPNDKNPNHEFHESFVNPLEASGKLLKLTYLDSPMISEAKKLSIPKKYPGGVNNVKFRCEYMCEIPNSSETSVIPEFGQNIANIVKEVELPNYADFYVSMDLGFKDLTIAIFGYYDFETRKIVILDEYVVNGPEMKTDILKRNIKIKEEIRFETKTGKKQVYMRYMDNNNLMLTNELSSTHKLVFYPTQKHDKDTYIDKLRMSCEKSELIIHPRCINLIYHVKNAQWHYTRNGTFTGKMKHLKGNEEAGLLPSHADGLDALIYFIRNVDKSRNPFPEPVLGENQYATRRYGQKNQTEGAKLLKSIFGLNKNKHL